MNFYEETKKYLQKTEHGVWALTSPHVLYLSHEQGKNYSANKENPNYNSFHDETVQIIDDRKDAILSSFGTSLTLVDLGPEYPDKTLPLMKEAKLKHVNLDYIPVDVNENYMRIAAKAAEPFAARVFGIHDLFENCAARIPKEANPERLVFIGLTFMNFESSRILTMMKSIAGPSGAIGIASELITRENSIADIEKHYRNEEIHRFILGTAKNLNLEPATLDFDVRFRNHRVEFGFVFKSPAPDLGILAGERLIIGVSYRYEIEELAKLLKDAGQSAKIWTSKSGKTAVALARV